MGMLLLDGGYMSCHLLDRGGLIIIEAVALAVNLDLPHEDTGICIEASEGNDEIVVHRNNLFRRIHLKFVGHFFFRYHQDGLLVLKC